jgi:PPOX class probable F420-dependent enzyme
MTTPARLDDPLVQAFLHARETGVLATLDPDGTPLAVPVWFVHDPDALYVPTVTATRKVENLARDGRVAFTTDAGRGDGIRGLLLQGRAEPLPDGPARRSIAERLLAKYDPHLERRWRGRVVPPDRVVLRVVPTRVRTWGL